MLELKPIVLSLEYRKEWNKSSKDFFNLYVDGKKVNDAIYRTGMWDGRVKDGYIMLLKYVEAFYSKEILKMSGSNKPKHLESQWCILNEKGEEKVCFEPYNSPYLMGGVIYSIKSDYFNIETNEFYCNASSTMNTDNYLFLENKYDKNILKRGVLKIEKKTGLFELIN